MHYYASSLHTEIYIQNYGAIMEQFQSQLSWKML
nr:MAG TPA: hypothetical protein [Caudoviricetes sp.]